MASPATVSPKGRWSSICARCAPSRWTGSARARAGGGCQWEDVDRAAFAQGLAVTGGTFWDTGIGGLTLGGGLGFLMGTAWLHLRQPDRRDGRDRDRGHRAGGSGRRSELLWALRGGGGNFGVVTEFAYRLHPVGPFTIGRVMVPLQPDGARGLELADELASSAPDELVIFVYGPSSIDADGNEVEAGTVPSFMRVTSCSRATRRPRSAGGAAPGAGRREIRRHARDLPGRAGGRAAAVRPAQLTGRATSCAPSTGPRSRPPSMR